MPIAELPLADLIDALWLAGQKELCRQAAAAPTEISAPPAPETTEEDR